MISILQYLCDGCLQPPKSFSTNDAAQAEMRRQFEESKAAEQAWSQQNGQEMPTFAIASAFAFINKGNYTHEWQITDCEIAGIEEPDPTANAVHKKSMAGVLQLYILAARCDTSLRPPQSFLGIDAARNGMREAYQHEQQACRDTGSTILEKECGGDTAHIESSDSYVEWQVFPVEQYLCHAASVYQSPHPGFSPHRSLAIEILDFVEEMLEERGVTIPDEERTGDEGEARLYGEAYHGLESDIASLLKPLFTWPTPTQEDAA